MKFIFFGDAFLQLGTIEDGPYPLQFRVGSLSDVYVDNNCTDIRDPVGGLSADELVVIYRYSMAQFDSIYPEFKGKVVKGEIPRAYRMKKMLEKTWLQDSYNDEDKIEVAHCYKLSTRTYTVFAGASCTLIKKYKKDEYPFVMKRKYSDDDGIPYIPVFHFKCFPSTEGFYNYGLGHYLFDIALLMARMDNMAYGHAEDNIYPVNVASVPKGKTSEFFSQLIAAHEARVNGGKGFVVMERNIDGSPGGSEVSLTPFQTQPITQEWERAFTRLEQNISRLGIQLDAADRGTSITATQILAESEDSDQLGKQIMEFNASESKFIVEVVLNMIQNLIDPEDDTPLNLTTTIEADGLELKMDNVTLGAVSDELREHKYFVKINSRSGTIPSNLMQQAQVSKALALAPPGSPAFVKLAIKTMQLNDQDIKKEDLGMGSPQAQGKEGPSPIPTETDPLMAQKGYDTVEKPLPAF